MAEAATGVPATTLEAARAVVGVGTDLSVPTLPQTSAAATGRDVSVTSDVTTFEFASGSGFIGLVVICAAVADGTSGTVSRSPDGIVALEVTHIMAVLARGARGAKGAAA